MRSSIVITLQEQHNPLSKLKKTSFLSKCLSVLTIVLMLFSNSSRSQTKYSTLWGKNGELWDVAGRLPDFSYAGFQSGTKAIPTYAVKYDLQKHSEAKPNDNIDDANELQKLIDSVKAPATIFIPKGIWNLDKRIYIKQSGIVLKGEEGTVLFMRFSLSALDKLNNNLQRDYNFSQAFINIEGKISVSNTPIAIKKAVNQGSKTITVNQGSEIKKGDLVKITQTDDEIESFYKYINGSSLDREYYMVPLNDEIKKDPILNSKGLFSFYTRVVALAGNQIALERPLPINLDLKWKPQLNIINMDETQTIQNIGLENLTLKMNGDAWTKHFDNKGFSAIYMDNVLNCWIKNITVVDADLGINMNNVSFSTLNDVQFINDKRPKNTESGHHAIWLRSSSRDNLISNFKFDAVYVHDLTVETHSSQNVFQKGTGVRINFDHHRGSPFANLFTEINLGDASRMMSSSGTFNRGPHSGIYTTLWNIKATSGFPEILPDNSNGGARLGKPAPDWYYLNAIGVLNVKAAPERNQFVEFNQDTNYYPKNIYESQLQQRLKKLKLNNSKSN